MPRLVNAPATKRTGTTVCAVVALCAALGLATAAAAHEPPVVFEDVSDRIPFTHLSLPFLGDGLIGVAWLDYDLDGDIDLFVANGRTQPNGLFRNDGDGEFTEVAAAAGVANGEGNSGVVVGDLDNDGDPDLMLMGEGGIAPLPTVDPPLAKLYRNDGDGTFTDVTDGSGLVGPETQMMVALGDIDNDGDLDAFMTAPGTFKLPLTQHRSKLFVNNGDLTFTDISASAGIDTDLGSCVVQFSDYDNDGWQDIFVGNCNDLLLAPTPIELFRNNGDLTFTDVASSAGLDIDGYWMSMASGDYDNDGLLDIFVTNFGFPGAGFEAPQVDNPHGLFRNNGDGTYTDVAPQAGAAQHPFGWGAVLTDFDNDGWSDLFFTGVIPAPNLGFIGPGHGNPGTYLVNNGDGTFEDLTSTTPADLSSIYTSGVAHGDFDDDGFDDLVIALTALPPFTDGQPLLWRNEGNRNRSLKIRTQGTVNNRDGVGARVTVDNRRTTQTKEVHAGASFSSANSPWMTFGIGRKKRADVEVLWPGPERIRNRLYRVRHGEKVLFPEIRCSFDGDWSSFGAYRHCLIRELTDRIQDDTLTVHEAIRFGHSAIRAFFDHRYGH